MTNEIIELLKLGQWNLAYRLANLKHKPSLDAIETLTRLYYEADIPTLDTLKPIRSEWFKECFTKGTCLNFTYSYSNTKCMYMKLTDADYKSQVTAKAKILGLSITFECRFSILDVCFKKLSKQAL